ncbi:MAG: tRNA (adenosine(37)-N6)-dimethylallyltransferase MiaA [Phycisphaerales bacterium]|nr:tRNA (adenosine(37)-N6)-dimethylallyltransferase MiaA [Phycisphaerales bacterium]
MPSTDPVFPLIIGPTAGGKSRLALELAARLPQAEIVTADSMQVYRGLDIGTAKPTPAEQQAVRHHLIDIAEPTEAFSVSRWLALAEAVIADCRSRGVTPVVVGGSHLYAKALLEGLFEGPAADPALRAQLGAMPPEQLRAALEEADPAAARRIHPADTRRTIRALEVFRTTGRPISEHQQQWDAGRIRPDVLLVSLDWPAELVNRRINARVKAMFEQGLVHEARALFEAGRLGPQAREALGYKQLVGHFEGRMSLDDAFEKIKIETRRFAKNQRTWLRRLSAAPGCVVLRAEHHAPETWAGTVAAALTARRSDL